MRYTFYSRGRESTNPAKMKLCPNCHNPVATSKRLIWVNPGSFIHI